MQQPGSVGSITTLWRYLGKKRRTQFIFLLFLMLVSVFAEVVTIGAVIPFLSALTAPEQLMQAAWAASIIQILGIQSPKELLLPMTSAFVLIAIGSAGVRITLLWFNSRLTAAM